MEPRIQIKNESFASHWDTASAAPPTDIVLRARSSCALWGAFCIGFWQKRNLPTPGAVAKK